MKHAFCKGCLRKYIEQETGGKVTEEGKKVCMVECPIRNCRMKVDLTEFAREAYGDNFAKYKETSTLSKNPFEKLVEENKEPIKPTKGKGKCFKEGCEVTKGYYGKLERCTKFCNFFICKEHWEAARDKVKEAKNECPGCRLKLDSREVQKYKKTREQTPLTFLEEKDMEYKLPKDD